MTGTMKSKKTKVWLAGLALAVSGSCLAQTEYKPERYNVILDRSPFGADPLLGGASGTSAQEKAAAAAAAAALAKDLRLNFLWQSDGGEFRAGLENLKDKKSFILSVGESVQGVKLLDIDMENSQATLERNGQPVQFTLDKAPVVSKAPARTAAPQRRFGGGFRRREPTPPPPKEPELSPEEQAKRREEIRANLQDYQMEVIRAGMPPLPIPLTQEMDDQLVSEGVLPPE
jgi:hypothetical protein